jgi:hypothetical protein
VLPVFGDLNLAGPQYKVLGSYRASLVTGVMAAGLAANADVLQLRWTDPNTLCLIERISCEGAGSIVAFAAGVTRFAAFVARAWTVDGSGGAAATLGATQKLRTTMPSPRLTTAGSALRISTTSALVAGTRTLDAFPHASVVASVQALAGWPVMPANAVLIESPTPNSDYVALAAIEGIVVQATVPTTGTWTAAFTVDWCEVALNNS